MKLLNDFLKNKINLSSVIILFLWFIPTCFTHFFFRNRCLFGVFYVFTMLYIFYLIYTLYSRKDNINIFSLLFIIAFSFFSLINQESNGFSNTIFLLVSGALHFIIVLCSLHLIYRSKIHNKNLTKKYIVIFLLLISIVISNYSVIYSSLQYVGLSDHQHLFEIDNGISEEVFPMAFDFLYYSSDTFFGTNISNVKINYLNYTDINEEISNYSEERKIEIQSTFNLTSVLLQIVKIVSLLESLSFLLFISIIVLNIPNEN